MQPIRVSSFTFVILMASTVCGEETHTNISCSAGSTCNLTGPQGCLYKNNMTYELKHGQDLGGWYDDGKLTIFNQFEGRLGFDKQNCAFILRNVTSKDSGMYTITGRYMENEQPKTPNITYNITVIACNEGFPAACISLAPLLNCALVYLLPWVVSFLHGRIFRTQDSTQDIQTFCLFISGFVSLACQIVSISLWLVCGILNNLVLFVLAISCTLFLGVAHIKSLCKSRSDCFGDRVKFALVIFSILQLSFPAFVVFAFSHTHGEIFVQKIWVFLTFAVGYLVLFILLCLVYIVYRYYCCPRTTEDTDATEMEKMNSSANGSSIKKTEKSPPSPV